MARVTVEDCVDKVPNRFELVLLAGHRARSISSGDPIKVPRDRDKNPVVALREIADKKLTPEELREDYIQSMQKHIEVDEPDEGNMAQLMAEDKPESVSLTEEDLLRALKAESERPHQEDQGPAEG